MGTKQKRISLLLSLVMVFSFVFTLTMKSSTALAYVATGDTCEDGSAPAAGTKECAETTRKVAGATATGDAKTDDAGVTCAVEKIGWILCPIMEGAGKISDHAFSILADNFLRTDPELVNDKAGTKVGWEVARNLANIMFIIVFLIIILSQVTGQGLNNYGIKKMLPRLIIAAIAVNVSYYICQLAVDLTNIIGYEVQNAMAQIANTVGPSVFGQASNYASTETGSDGMFITLIVTGALAAGVAVYFLLPTIIALVPLILITVMTVIIILLLRKALIVLLIVISPIAFVMYLLPNTEKYFSKWMSMFGKLLMVFPIIGLLFGAGQLASTIILVSGSDGNQAEAAAKCDPDNKTSKDNFDAQKKGTSAGASVCGEKYITIKGGKNGNNTCFVTTTGSCPVDQPKNLSWTLGLVAMGIAVAPLLAVWSVLQGALSAAGAIGGRLTSAVSKGMGGLGKPANGAAGALSKRIGENRTAAWQRRQARGLEGGSVNPLTNVAGGIAKRRGNRAMRQNLSKHALDTATSHAVKDNMGNLLGGLTSAEVARAKSSILAQDEQHKVEEVKNAQTKIRAEQKGDFEGIADLLLEALKNNDNVTARAAQNELMGMGGAGIDRFAQAMIAAEKAGSGASAAAIADLKINTATSHGGIKEKSGDLNKWMSNLDPAKTLADASSKADSFSGLSDKQIIGQTHAALHAAVATGAIGQGDATRILGTEAASELGGTQRKMLEDLAKAGSSNTAVAAAHAPKVDPSTGATTRRV